MPDYWIDSDSLIRSKNGAYGFDIAPSFWSSIERKMSEGVISSSIMVYGELENGDEDDLLRWGRQQKENRYFVEPDEEVQRIFRQIADYVNGRYPQY